ncbi:MAG: YdeI/OmpD-associated family protein [Bacteroidia bacterium]|nr:YdeI/OmpD-associated family protein [Bacteroidia bacterium]
MNQLNDIPILEFKSCKTFQTWLDKNHNKSTGIWLRIFKKDTGIKTITYAEALDIALCYGWIDGHKKSLDSDSWIQKFCQRSAKSIWSKVNVGHAERLINEAKMKPAGLKVIQDAKADGRWERAYDSPSKMKIPDDFLKLLSKNKTALNFFKTLNKSNLYSIGFRLQTAKKPETREKRMNDIIEKLAKGEKFH